jgi:hypothetical protein
VPPRQGTPFAPDHRAGRHLGRIALVAQVPSGHYSDGRPGNTHRASSSAADSRRRSRASLYAVSVGRVLAVCHTPRSSPRPPRFGGLVRTAPGTRIHRCHRGGRDGCRRVRHHPGRRIRRVRGAGHARGWLHGGRPTCVWQRSRHDVEAGATAAIATNFHPTSPPRATFRSGLAAGRQAGGPGCALIVTSTALQISIDGRYRHGRRPVLGR